MNRTSEYALTIVVPVFNEEDNIHNLEKALTEFRAESGHDAGVVRVDSLESFMASL